MLEIALLGLGAGAVYALLAQGLIVIYRASGVVNFAQGAFAMFAAYVFNELRADRGWDMAPAMVVVVVGSALLGAAVQVLVMRPMRKHSALARAVTTIGILLVLQYVAFIRWGSIAIFVQSYLPTGSTDLPGGPTIGNDRLTVLVVSVLLTGALWMLYRFTLFGLVTQAVAEREVAATAVGRSPQQIAVINWAIGCGLAGLGGVLISPMTGLEITLLSMLIMPALAAAVVATFRSFPIALAAALGIGILEALAGRYITEPGIGRAIPFLIVILIFVFRGQGLPLRDHIHAKLPSIETGRFPRWGLLVFGAVVIVITSQLDASWTRAAMTTAAAGVIALSVVVITGYAGQLSLAQYAIAGAGALPAAYVMRELDGEILAALLAGVVVALPLGLLVALPSLKTRGINLAIATLGLGIVISSVLFENSRYSGGVNGVEVGRATIFGWEVDAQTHVFRYAVLAVIVLCIVMCATLNLRASKLGRSMIAVRSNERAAASLGVDVYATKVVAFVIASVMASLGGCLLAFQFTTAVFSESFTSLESLLVVAFVVLGGVGYVAGALLAAIAGPGSVVAHWMSTYQGASQWIQLVGAALMVLQLVAFGDGVVPGHIVLIRHHRNKGKHTAGEDAAAGKESAAAPAAVGPAAAANGTDLGRLIEETPLVEGSAQGWKPVPPRTLGVSSLSVAFGGVQAVQDVSFSVRPGEVVGLIGPNGAGKTTIIDGLTGYVRAQGDVRIDDVFLVGRRPHQRAKLGVVRSFQSIELFDDLTVRENILIGCEPGGFGAALRSLVRTREPELSEPAGIAVEELELSHVLDDEVSSLPFARRRLVGIARTLAMHPSILLLDEPAAGLDARAVAELSVLVRALADRAGIGVLLVEHHLDMVVEVSDRIVALQGGRVIATGSPDEIVADPRVREAYIGTSSTAELV